MGSFPEAVLAIDIGGSKFIIGFVDRDGHILHMHREEWEDPSDGNRVLSQLMGAVGSELRKNSRIEVLAAGVAVPGFVDSREEAKVSMSLGGLRRWPVAREMNEKFGLKTFANNDAKCCALAEMWFGSCRDCDDFLYMTVSTGVGGAFVLDGRLYDGAYGRAGEIGNSYLVKNGRENGKGRRGTFEMYAATEGMAKNYLELGGLRPENGTKINGEYIARRAAQGDGAAVKTFELEGELLATIIAQACNMLDIERVVIGGGISLSFELFRDSLEKNLYVQKYWRDGDFSVVPTVLGYEGALIGAATVALLGIGEKLSRPGPSKKHKMTLEG